MYTVPFIDIKRILQEKYYYCGQACIKMFDSDITLSQDELWELTQKYADEPDIWYTDPVGIINVLKEKSNKLVKLKVIPKELTKKASIKSLISGLCEKKPILIPSRGGAHWVIINGVQQNDNGQVTGIFLIDPWKGMPGTSFYAFSEFFFKTIFSTISFDGKWNGKKIVLSCGDTEKDLPIDVKLQTRLGGGSMDFFESLVDEDIFNMCANSFENLGFELPNKTKAGGFLSKPIDIYDIAEDVKYKIVCLEQNDKIAWSVVNLDTKAVEYICFSDEVVLYSSDEVEENLRLQYPNKTIQVFDNAIFDSQSPCLFSYFDFVYEAIIDDNKCYVKAQDNTIIYNLRKLLHLQTQE